MQFRIRVPWLALAVVIGLGGCSSEKSSTETADGCYTDAQVPATVRTEVEAASAQFYAAVRMNSPGPIVRQMASEIRERGGQQQFLDSVGRIIRALGLPDSLTTQSMAYVKFGADNPYTQQVTCGVEGSEEPLTLLLTDFPEQVSLVQVGQVGADWFYYSSMWFREAEGWRLATFFAKPATLYARNWEQFAERAANERLEKRQRNAALLYNVALDLVVPAAWVKPPQVDSLQREQRRIMVTGLPKGRLDAWPMQPDTLYVREVSYGIRSDALGLVVAYNARGSLADTTYQAADARRIHEYMAGKYPEYGHVFKWLTLRAVDPARPESEWTTVLPLEPGS